MDEQKRVDERARGLFCCDLTVDTKCSYQNPNLVYVRVDVAKDGSWFSHIGFERCLFQEDRRGDLQNKGL